MLCLLKFIIFQVNVTVEPLLYVVTNDQLFVVEIYIFQYFGVSRVGHTHFQIKELFLTYSMLEEIWLLNSKNFCLLI